MAGTTNKKIDDNPSRVFTILKVLSILMVLIGHFFKEYDFLWVPVTVGLLVFSFSSGYFTSIKYSGDFNKRMFWLKKFERLGVNLIVINVFLLFIFLFEGRQGIWSWYSLVNVVGLNGFLNWFKIIDPSPFGAGMWFFTLLILFYSIYPFLNKFSQTGYSIFSLFFILIAFYLNQHINFGHALWLTACGFITGVWAGKNEIKLPLTISLLGAFFSFIAMMGCNLVFDFKALNFLFTLFFSLAGIYSCLAFNFPNLMYRATLFFSGALFEIYLIHSYLFIEPTRMRSANFIISMIVIILLAKGLSLISFKIHTQILPRF